MMRRLTLAAFTIMLTTLAPATPALTQTPQTPRTPRIEAIPPGIVAVLDDYGRAFQSRNRALLARVVTGPLQAAELRAFDYAAAISFRVFRVRALTQYSGSFASARVRSKYPGKQVAAYQVMEETALDLESQVYVDDGGFTFVREPDADDKYNGWRLAGKNDFDVIAFFSPYHLWDAGPVKVLRSDHFALLTHPELVDEMRPVLGVAERSYERAAEFWPRAESSRYVIIVPATTEELGELIHADFDLRKFVAFVSAGATEERGWEPTGPRLFIHLSHLRNYDQKGQIEIIAHELIHALTRPVSGPHIPTWVEEGVANAGSGIRLGRVSGPLPDQFPTDDRFLVGSVGQIVTIYNQSQVAIEALIEKFGREGLARLYERLGTARVVAGSDRFHLRAATDDALGWTMEEWLAEWRKRLG